MIAHDLPAEEIMRKEKGFSLIEIMIVVMIIGLLLAVAVPNAIRARENSMRYTCISNLRQIDSAKSIWSTEYFGSPSMEVLVPDYLRATPECPSGGTYILGGAAEDTTCTTEGHVVDEDS